MTQSKGAGVSVLSAMTAAVTEAAPRGPKGTLTALAGETNGPSILTKAAPGLPPTPASFPNDAPTEVVLQSIVEIERQIANLQEVARALRLLAGDPEVVRAQVEQTKEQTEKALEKEADRRHQDRVLAGKEPAKDKAEATKIEKAKERVAKEVPIAEVRTKAEMMAGALAEAGMTEGDEAFQDRLKRLAEEAQAATFTPRADTVADSTVEGGEDPEPGPADDGWTCPIHGKYFDTVSKRRNREYRKCPVEGCPEFEKL